MKRYVKSFYGGENYVYIDSGLWILIVQIKMSFQLDFTFQHGLEAVRILLLEGLNKSATFVNSAKPLEQLG